MTPVTITIPDIQLAQYLRMKLEDVTNTGTREVIAFIQVTQAIEAGIQAAQQTPPATSVQPQEG